MKLHAERKSPSEQMQITSLCLTGKILKQTSFVSHFQFLELKALCKEHFQLHFMVQPAMAHTVTFHWKLFSSLSNNLAGTSGSLSASTGQPQQPAISSGFSSSKEFLLLFHIPRLDVPWLISPPTKEWPLFLGLLTAYSWTGPAQDWKNPSQFAGTG